MKYTTTIGCDKSIFFSLILVFPSFVFCQGNYLNVQILPVDNWYSSNECEPLITINPINPIEIAAGSILAGSYLVKAAIGEIIDNETLGGETRSAVIMVNQDKTKSHQFFTSIAIDQSNGDLHFVYYDRSKDVKNKNKTDVVWCRSSDGGKTFKSEIISESSFIPEKKIFFGDYLGIAVNKGMVRPIWPRMDKKKITLWTAIIDSK